MVDPEIPSFWTMKETMKVLSAPTCENNRFSFRKDRENPSILLDSARFRPIPECVQEDLIRKDAQSTP